ncbi:hypothetical protein DIPPA_30172 [Diplonema papillatum]|nr:hypothetical protein DIPPA_30172 [Diplonema papillatum]
MESGDGRTAGKTPATGRLRLGQVVAQASALGVKSSIPSRYETILFSGDREQNAFGRRTHRFDGADDDLPGPGHYRKPRSLLRKNVSESKKGTCTFASASRISAEKPRPLFLTPGPGQYEDGVAHSDGQSLGASAAKSGATGTVSFAKPVPRRALVGAAAPSGAAPQPGPGPGDYHCEPPARPTAPSAIFSSKTPRDPAFQQLLLPGPGPGDYDVAPQQAGFGVGGATPAFKHPSERSAGLHDPSLSELAKALPRPPPPPGVPAAKHPTQPASPGRPSSSSPTHSGGGGPADLIHSKRSRPVPSSMFASTLLDRFGRPVVRYVPEAINAPGPGQYEIEAAKQKLLISSSWAMSSTSRFKPASTEHFKPPGPAFYKPGAGEKQRSFLLNPKGKWI